MRVLAHRSVIEGVRLRTDVPIHALFARERDSIRVLEIPFRAVDGEIALDYESLQSALPARFGRYDLLAQETADGEEQSIRFAEFADLPIWRRYFRSEDPTTPMLAHLYINRGGSFSAVVRAPSNVDNGERTFASRHEISSISLRRGALRCSFEVTLGELGDFDIARCYLKLFSDDEVVETAASILTQERQGATIRGSLSIPVGLGSDLPPVRYALYLTLRDRLTSSTIDLKINRVSETLFAKMRRMSRPPTLPVADGRVLTLGGPPTSTIVSFVVRPSTIYDTQHVRQYIFINIARATSRFRRLVGRIGRPTALIFEKDAATAQDNGIALFRHLLESSDTPAFDYFFIMDRDSAQWDRVAGLDRVVSKFSFRYWKLLISPGSFLVSSDARYHVANIVSQPGAAGRYAYVLKSYFLQHGVTGLKRVKILQLGSSTHPDAMVVAANWEKQLLVQDGNPADTIDVVGFARWDRLVKGVPPQSVATPRTLLYMPTWREWLEGRNADELRDSDYAQAIGSFLGSSDLHALLRKHDCRLTFLAHPKLPQLSSLFEGSGSLVTVLHQEQVDFAEIIHRSTAVVTDYSSIVWDFVQARKPALLFQFDLGRYLHHTGMYSSPEFDRIIKGFPTAYTEDEMLKNLGHLLAADPDETSTHCAELAQRTFPHHDRGNCARTVPSITRRLPDLSTPRSMPDYAEADREYQQQLPRSLR